MNLRHARTFATVAELGTVSKAAQRLRIAQPALSRQISGFEHELGSQALRHASAAAGVDQRGRAVAQRLPCSLELCESAGRARAAADGAETGAF